MNRLPDTYPKNWETVLEINTVDMLEFRNLLHFKTHVANLTQEDDSNCDVSYADALAGLLAGSSTYTEQDYMTIRNLVRSNLHKQGLITEDVYENYRYTVDGIIVDYDMGKYAAGEPECVITPSVQYVDFFYELYVNISYHYGIPNSTIKDNMNKMLATIEELQRQHINIKISLVFPACKSNGRNNFFSSIPLFSHRDFKTAEIMSSVLNERLLRKFYFAVLEDYYKENLTDGKGSQLRLPRTMNLADEFNEVEFFTNIQKCATEGED